MQLLWLQRRHKIYEAEFVLSGAVFADISPVETYAFWLSIKVTNLCTMAATCALVAYSEGAR